VGENAVGAAIRAAYLGLKQRGGKVFVFQSGLPSTGPGVLRSRDDGNAIGTDKEKALFASQDPFYPKVRQFLVLRHLFSTSFSPLFLFFRFSPI